ncbi:MAG: hypothetical protein HOM55_09495 [Proteobacteria bacterium]|jgi:hypothetical protein|nr:hypothetical protein [Pseudomonadota bacterium]
MSALHIRSVVTGSIVGMLLLLNTPSASAETHTLLVQGLGGEAWYQRQFDEQADTIGEALKSVVGEPQLTILRGSDANRQVVMDWFDGIAVNADDDDSALVVLIGHGTFDDVEYKFNIPGPDLSFSDLQQGFSQINVPAKVLINTSSSSGALLDALKEEPITLLTATKNGRERNATRFGRFFARAFVETAADLDKNQKISLQEAFDYAERATNDFYESEGLLATEHAFLQQPGEGQIAGRMTLANLGSQDDSMQSPELIALFEQRDQLDLRIESLRLRRIGMGEQDYEYVFQILMLDLIMVQDEIDLLDGVNGE